MPVGQLCFFRKTIVRSFWPQAGQIAAVFNGLRQRDLPGVKSGSKTWSDYRIRLPDTSDHLPHPNLLALIRSNISFLANFSIKKKTEKAVNKRQTKKDKDKYFEQTFLTRGIKPFNHCQTVHCNWCRPQRSIETIASFDQWSGTIKNHWKQW